MENDYNTKLNIAKAKVKKIKEFYQHLIVYLIINIILILINLGILKHGIVDWDILNWRIFITPFFWGIGLFFHWLKVFNKNFKFIQNWEKRKIDEFIKEDDEFIEKYR